MIIAGAALAVVRTGSSTYNLGVVLLNTILGALSLALGVRVRRKGEFFGLETGPGIGWLLIALSALLLLIAVLVVVGLAAGVK